LKYRSRPVNRNTVKKAAEHGFWDCQNGDIDLTTTVETKVRMERPGGGRHKRKQKKTVLVYFCEEVKSGVGPTTKCVVLLVVDDIIKLKVKLSHYTPLRRLGGRSIALTHS
jgi:hypothetical protein